MISAARKQINSWALEHQLMLGILLFNIVDFLTTKILVDRRGSLDTESNLMLYNAMDHWDSVWMILIIKALFVFVGWGIMYRFLDPAKHRSVKYVLLIVLLPYIAISAFNYYLVLNFDL